MVNVVAYCVLRIVRRLRVFRFVGSFWSSILAPLILVVGA